MDVGEKVASNYADSVSVASRDIERRAPTTFDPRGTFRTPRKSQLDTELCGKLLAMIIVVLLEPNLAVSFTTTTMVEVCRTIK